ncbi:hypothetical protein [Psychrobacillus vulpis]|uniref:MarR family transcriptional regulator n=1 Tax=Psychrobacillus vulpis TaxID=2325572 RepID=A0A544TW31_9BACI|nr:hypothetical protein [Psychrobacillus vulpis]TQR21660.1 hypothetical protein FG384_01510 [Psychrobacillus vulpis]
MGRLTIKEQILLAYYVYNFEEDSEESMKELEGVIDSIQNGHKEVLYELEREGLISRAQEDNKRRITNEGILYIDNILNIQSYAIEGNKLAYVKDSLLINEIDISADPLKEYIYQHVGIED